MLILRKATILSFETTRHSSYLFKSSMFLCVSKKSTRERTWRNRLRAVRFATNYTNYWYHFVFVGVKVPPALTNNFLRTPFFGSITETVWPILLTFELHLHFGISCSLLIQPTVTLLAFDSLRTLSFVIFVVSRVEHFLFRAFLITIKSKMTILNQTSFTNFFFLLTKLYLLS